MVRPFEIQEQTSYMGNSYKLADSFCRILFPGPSQQNRQLYLYHCAVKNYSGSDNAGRFFGIFGSLSKRGFPLELCGRIFIDSPGRFYNLQKMVSFTNLCQASDS
jgi:hypothetical protein